MHPRGSHSHFLAVFFFAVFLAGFFATFFTVFFFAGAAFFLAGAFFFIIGMEQTPISGSSAQSPTIYAVIQNGLRIIDFSASVVEMAGILSTRSPDTPWRFGA
jgi:hypothetical protein